MIINIEPWNHLNLKKFSSELETFKEEILSAGSQLQEEDAYVLEIIKVLQEEIPKRKGKKKDVSSDVRFLAYLNLLNSIMKEAWEGDPSEFDLYDEEEDLDDGEE